MKITVCQMRDEIAEFKQDWNRLIEHSQREKPDLILLPEMVFSPWFAKNSSFDPETWKRSVLNHDEAEKMIDDLWPSCVLGSRPVNDKNKRLNQAFVWGPDSGITLAHTKYNLPNEEGYWEANWYHRGNGLFEPIQYKNALIGFLICTELWFYEHARQYAKKGVHLIACPRATPHSTLDKWLAGGRVAAVVSGAYCISSNKFSQKGTDLGGQGWIVDPEGEVMCITSVNDPILTLEIDLDISEKAKKSYPRYVED
ncbi:carbon-nitrogen hydrolase family protein [Acidobacteriota bacterium]